MRPSSSSSDPEEGREEARRRNPQGLSAIHTGVSVKQAEADFSGLQRQLSSLSRASRPAAHDKKETDVEKSGELYADSPATDEEPFDLESYLRTGMAAERAASMRPQAPRRLLGTAWWSRAWAAAPTTSRPSRTPSSASSTTSPPLRNLLGLGPKGTEATLLDGFRGLCKPGEMVLVLGKPGKRIFLPLSSEVQAWCACVRACVCV